MKVFLLEVEPDRRLFYSEVVATAGSEPPHRGLRGWVEARLHRLRDRVVHAEAGAAKQARAVWEWLHKRTHPDETLYSRLRSAASIEVRHPPAIDEAEAREAWTRFLSRGRRRHWPWLLACLALVPIAVLLTPIPGPNLVGYWFAYRSLHHLLILVGLGRVRNGRVETRFLAAWELEGSDPHEALEALGCDPAGVLDFLVRQGVPAEAREHPR